MQPIRIAVSGLGRIGWDFHCKQIAKHREFELAAVMDPEAARRREAEATFGCASFKDFARMLREADFEAVVVASPSHLHKTQALAAFRHGCHVFLEKPMALSLREAQTIAAAAKRAKCVLTVYQPHRAMAYFQHLLRLLAKDTIGEIYHVRRGMFNLVRRNDWQSLTRFGGGMLNNYGAHALDQLLAITGYDVKKSFCTLRRVGSLGDAEDVVNILYETRKGMLGEVDINQALATKPFDLEVRGTHGVIHVNRTRLVVRTIAKRHLRRKPLQRQLASTNRQYPSDKIAVKEKVIQVNPRYGVDVYKNLAAAIRKRGKLLVPPTQTLAVMKLMQDCRKDSRGIKATPM